MTRTRFSARIGQAAKKKKSRIILAVDPKHDTKNVRTFAKKTIGAVAGHICGIKVNFHLLLPLSGREIRDINEFAHSHGLVCIADIKINDIDSTNKAALAHLAAMGFDAIIANPFMGAATLVSFAKEARKMGLGVIALVYMSHPDAKDGYGLQAGRGAIYEIFLERAANARVDGVVVGATQADILKKVRGGRLAIYSPGVGAQGGDVEQAVRNGSDYLIVGRSIIGADDPAGVASDMNRRAQRSLA